MQAAREMADRAKTYDNEAGERSMAATVAAFNAVTGDGLMNSEERGCLFMLLLKAVRSQQGAYREDSYVDGAAYFGLAGEAACRARNGGWTPEAIEAAKLTKDPIKFWLPIHIKEAESCDNHPLAKYVHLAPKWADRLLQPAGSRSIYALNEDGRTKLLPVTSDQQIDTEQRLIFKR